jgi:hypothetical protein
MRPFYEEDILKAQLASLSPLFKTTAIAEIYDGLETMSLAMAHENTDPASEPQFKLQRAKDRASFDIHLSEAGDSADIWLPCCTAFATRPGFRHPLPQLRSDKWSDRPPFNMRSASISIATPIILAILVIILYAAISRFEDGTETTGIQKGFILAWVILGSYGGFTGYYFHIAADGLVESASRDTLRDFVLLAGLQLVFLAVFLVPGVGGMVIVGLMTKDFGQCTRV